MPAETVNPIPRFAQKTVIAFVRAMGICVLPGSALRFVRRSRFLRKMGFTKRLRLIENAWIKTTVKVGVGFEQKMRSKEPAAIAHESFEQAEGLRLMAGERWRLRLEIGCQAQACSE